MSNGGKRTMFYVTTRIGAHEQQIGHVDMGCCSSRKDAEVLATDLEANGFLEVRIEERVVETPGWAMATK